MVFDWWLVDVTGNQNVMDAEYTCLSRTYFIWLVCRSNRLEPRMQSGRCLSVGWGRSVRSVRFGQCTLIIDIIAPSVPLSLWPQPHDFYIFYFLDLFPHHTSIGHAKNWSYRTTVSNKPGNANICGDCSRRFCGASLQTVDAVLVRLVLCCWCREVSIL